MKELSGYHVADGSNEQHYALVTGNKKLVNTLAQQILEVHFTESIQKEAVDELGFDLQQIRKQCDPLLRKNVLRAYNYQCAMCGFSMHHNDITAALEVMHIKRKQHDGPCEIPNGLALRAIHHEALDKGSIGLDEDMQVSVSDAVNGGGIIERSFRDFDGKAIALPQVRRDYSYEVPVE